MPIVESTGEHSDLVAEREVLRDLTDRQELRRTESTLYLAIGRAIRADGVFGNDRVNSGLDSARPSRFVAGYREPRCTHGARRPRARRAAPRTSGLAAGIGVLLVRAVVVVLPLALWLSGIGWLAWRRVDVSVWALLCDAAVWGAAVAFVAVRSRTPLSRKAMELRRCFETARRHFTRELRRPRPVLRDEWIPYLLALGLGKGMDRWVRVHGAGAPSPSSQVFAGSAATTPPPWSGGGGEFSGGGASGSWAALGSISSRISPPSSSGDSGSSGSSSGGGGGGGW